MTCCAIEGCDRPECPVCSVPRRFARVIEQQANLKDQPPKGPPINGTKKKRTEKERTTH